MNIGETIRNFRLQRSMSQGDIEKRTGLLRCYLSRVENGHTIPSLDTLAKIAGAMDLALSCIKWFNKVRDRELKLNFNGLPGYWNVNLSPWPYLQVVFTQGTKQIFEHGLDGHPVWLWDGRDVQCWEVMDWRAPLLGIEEGKEKGYGGARRPPALAGSIGTSREVLLEPRPPIARPGRRRRA